MRYAPKIDHASDSRTCRPRYTRERSCGISTEICRRGRSTSTTGRGTRKKKKKKRPRSRANRRIDSRDLGRARGAPSAEYRNNTLDARRSRRFSAYISLPYTYIMTLTVLTVLAIETILYDYADKKTLIFPIYVPCLLSSNYKTCSNVRQ